MHVIPHARFLSQRRDSSIQVVASGDRGCHTLREASVPALPSFGMSRGAMILTCLSLRAGRDGTTYCTSLANAIKSPFSHMATASSVRCLLSHGSLSLSTPIARLTRQSIVSIRTARLYNSILKLDTATVHRVKGTPSPCMCSVMYRHQLRIHLTPASSTLPNRSLHVGQTMLAH